MLKRFAICLALVAAGMFASPSDALATVNTIRGNLTYNDGISAIVAGDTFTVEAIASDGKSTYFTVTLAASSYIITYESTALPTANRTITLNFKLNGAVDRKLEWGSGGVTRIQTIDVAFTKAPNTVLTNSANSVIRGVMYYKDGITTVTSADSPKVTVKDANNNLVGTANGSTYTITITGSSLPANKAVTVEYWIGGAVNRTAPGVIGNDTRLQTIDIIVNK